MDYLLAVYILGILVNMVMLHKHFSDAWSSKIPKFAVIFGWVLAMVISWFWFPLAHYAMKKNR